MALARVRAACTTRKTDARNAKASVSPKHVKYWSSIFPEAQSKIPPFSSFVSDKYNRREGDKIVLEGEADQVPGQEPGDIVFNLVQTEHTVFSRAGADLSANIEVTLAEGLCGFSRVVIKHLDGRGIHIQHPQATARVLEPGQIIKVKGEGMPYKKNELKGDLYLVVRIKFPEHGWLEEQQAMARLKELLPKPEPPIQADIIDNVAYDESASLEDFGGDTEGGGTWEDEDDDDGGQPQCAQQ